MEADGPLRWEELELPVLEWVLYPEHEALDLGYAAATSPLAPGVTDQQVDDALLRLEREGLIVGHRWEGTGAGGWTGLRPTASGLRVLGEWPPVPDAALNDARATVLPIGWIAVGDPARLFPPERHEELCPIQRELDFPGTGLVCKARADARASRTCAHVSRGYGGLDRRGGSWPGGARPRMEPDDSL